MRQYAIKHMMDRLSEVNFTVVSDWFDFTLNEKKKYPYLKVTDRMAYTSEDILWEDSLGGVLPEKFCAVLLS